MSKVDESSTTANIKGYLGRFPGPGLVKKRKRKAKKKSFTEQVANECLDDLTSEIVRKRGNTWVLYDDKTGVELGSYKDRKTAWAKQRIFRAQKKNNPSYKKRTKTPKKKKGQRSLASIRKALSAISKKKHESFVALIAHKLLAERFNAYVFEQSPTSASEGWEEFLGSLSQQTLMSDPKLKALLDAFYKNRLKTLDKAAAATKKNIEKAGKYAVTKPVLDKSDKDKPFLKLVIAMPDTKKKVPVAVRIEANKPSLFLPEITLAALNNSMSDAKILRATLMHLQDVELPHIMDLQKAADKRDQYLKTLEKNTDKIVNAMLPVQVAALKNLLNRKYKSVR